MARTKAMTVNSSGVQVTTLSNISNANYFESKNVRMYPSSKRSDRYDRNARLTTERNLVNVINRLTSRDSFIIHGLSISTSEDKQTQILVAGDCNIHGYYFNLLNNVTINNSGDDNLYKKAELLEDDGWLYLKILVKKTLRNATDGTSIEYEELITEDTNSISKVDVANTSTLENVTDSLDLIDDDADTAWFTGLQLVVDKANLSNAPYNVGGPDSATLKYTYYYLPLAEIIKEVSDDDKVTVTFKSFDAVSGAKKSWNELPLSAEDAYVKVNASSMYSEDYSKPQDLVTWLQQNFVIDDGLIE